MFAAAMLRWGQAFRPASRVMKRIAILGSTGSIGQSALAVIAHHRDRLSVTALAAGTNTELFAQQLVQHRPRVISMSTDQHVQEVTRALPSDVEREIRVSASGNEGLRAVATADDVDIVLCASSGTQGLSAVLAAIECGKVVALANKEVLVMAGALIMAAAERSGALILPVDSEHNAIHQCLHERPAADIRRLILTASGGPFREWPAALLDAVSPTDALSHPTWRMGRKITIDSATLMNKGLEVIEAHWLFGVPAEAIEVVIHPQSVVHSMVEFRDGSIIAQLGVTDMRLPIQYAFSYPERWDAPVPSLDLARLGRLEFEAPDHERFPCLGHAYRALRAGGAYPIVLNAANEVAVTSFLDEALPFSRIPQVIERALDAYAHQETGPPTTIGEICAVDAWSRAFSAEVIRGLESKVEGRP